MKTLTLSWLKKQHACADGTDWFKAQKDHRLSVLLPKLVEEGYFAWANWVVVRLMAHPQKVLYGIEAAQAVLAIFETKRPGDDRPRKAIDAARAFLRGEMTPDEVRSTADAAYAAADAADAAYAAAYAADAAYAAYAAAYAADAAANAAYAAANAAASADARKKFQHGQIRFAMAMLGIQEEGKK